jgi:hypothetical protein
MSDPLVERISPELVLVDPELAARHRAAAVATPAPLLEVLAALERQQAGTTRAEAPTPPEAVLAPEAPALSSAATERSDRHIGQLTLPRLKLAAAGLVVALLLGAAFLPPRQAPQLATTTATAAASRPTLVWPAHGRGYRVEIYVGRRLVHAENTSKNRYAVPRWLAPGRYTWRAFSDGWRRRAGRVDLTPLDEGWFDVGRTTDAPESPTV